MKLCIATESQYVEKPWREDVRLRQELTDLGCTVDIRDWMEPGPWRSYDGIFVSSTWNIPQAPREFEEWLDLCESDGIQRFKYSSLGLGKTDIGTY